MVEIIGLRFRKVGKTFYFLASGVDFKIGEKVVVQTAKGLECGEVVLENRNINIDNAQLRNSLKKVIRKATKNDIKRFKENKKLEKKAFDICKKKISDYKLNMTLLNVEYIFDCSKILFYFTSEERIDFRGLVKELAAIFRTRIELRQVGVRDEAKILGGLGICGRPLCCNTFLGEFQPVSIKMAKEQNLSLNPTKVSGTCGRLMCCLKYEHDAYQDLLKKFPKSGAIVETPDGKGSVVDVNLISGNIKVLLDNSLQDIPKSYNIKELTIISDPKNKHKIEE